MSSLAQDVSRENHERKYQVTLNYVGKNKKRKQRELQHDFMIFKQAKELSQQE